MSSRTALDGLELEVADGEFFCLLGPSGAGKTTTLKTIAGLEQPSAGTVELDGVDMSGVEPYDRGVALCFESYALYPHRTAYDNLASPLRSPRHRLPADQARERIGAVARLLGIGGLLDRPVAQLSNGQRQRVALGDLALGGYGFEVTVRIGEQQLSLVVPRAHAAGLRPDDPVRLTVRPESLLLFEADGPRRPGRRISA